MKWFTKLPFVIKVMIGGICLIAIVTLGFCIWTIILLETRERERQERWEEMLSSSISEEIVEDLCSLELVPIDIADCESPDIEIPYRSIPSIFEANVDIEEDTYDDVTAVFGVYEDYCESEPELDCEDGYTCDYQFRWYVVRVFYDCSTDQILRIHWATPGDS